MMGNVLAWPEHAVLSFIAAQLAGVTYGMTSVLVGHPMDTIKNKMQAQQGYEARNAIGSLIRTVQTQGVFGLYRGATPQFIGSMVFRSLQFSTYTALHSRMDNQFGRYEIPLTGGLQVRVVVGGMASGIVRGAIETPIDYWKIRRQVVKSMQYKEALSGLKVTLLGRVILLPVFFIYLEKARPLKWQVFGESAMGTFVQTGMCATAAWWTIWPLEYMKSQIQGGYGKKDLSLLQRLSWMVRERGFFALYRGLGPGSIRSFTANGLSMIVMKWTEKHLTTLAS
jgi:solute carrier family 25 carnitine/acylcarnitine transporter 20/29